MATPSISALPESLIREMKLNGVWKEGSPVPLERLSLITIPYIDFSGKEHKDGQMVTLDVVAPLVAEAFSQLYNMSFPINKIRSIHHYAADDEASMADNNSSAFCFRQVVGGNTISIHSYGVAIDINPQQNPYVLFDEEQGTAKIYPKSGWEYMNRHKIKPGMVEDIVSLWTNLGFLVWGGNWTTPIDYHHFQLHRGTAELLTVMPVDDGKLFIKTTLQHKDKLAILTAMPSGEKLQPIIELYRKNRSDFFEQWIDLIA